MTLEIPEKHDPILPEELKAVLAINAGLNKAWDILDRVLPTYDSQGHSVRVIDHNGDVFAEITIKGIVFYPEDQK